MISVVIPVLDNHSYTRDLLTDISMNVVKPDEIIIIDNGSKDSYEDMIRILRNPSINYTRFNENRGVNTAWNLGIMLAKNPLITILNNDVLLNNYFFKKVLQTMQDPFIGICVPNNLKHAKFYDVDEDVRIKDLEKREGWAFTIRKEIVTKCGYIPDKLKIFCGDDFLFDSSKRIGFRNVKMINNYIFHYGSVTVRQYDMDRSILKSEKICWEQIKKGIDGG
jgi:GT2 family glycosyltransferase